MLTNEGLVLHAKKALVEKWGYVYGTFGLVLTEKILQDKLKQYPDNIKPYEDFIRKNWLGKITVDCVGLIKSYMWWKDNKLVYDSSMDVSANGMYSKAIEKGTISTIPEIPGLCVWKDGHIGIYVGNGQVIEAKGTKYGVVMTPLKGTNSTPWTHWLKCPFIEYIQQEGSDIMVEKAFYKKMKVTASALNIRNKPSTSDSKVFGQFTNGEIITCTGVTKDNWYRCIYKDADAFVSGSYLEDYNEPVIPDLRSEVESLKKTNTELMSKINAIKNIVG